MPTWVPWPLVEKTYPISFSDISRILPPVSAVFSPHLDRRLSPQGLDPLKYFLKFTLAWSATAPSYNMALITTSIKSNKSSFSTTPYIQRLASLFPISIAVVPLYSADLCVSVCVLVCFSLCVVIIVFFSDCRIYLSSSLAARVFNKLTCRPYFHTLCGPSANLECRCEMCCMWLAGNTGRKKSPFRHHRTTLSGYIFGTKACIDNRKKTC